ncbi:MAG: 2-hydroxyacid dehydrogenase [Oscillospiraceae bacterium]|jgi:D-3-phosphoglycerate dehydrogenase|nr:2-hydroxyacid dehydrogenase [Oscillospiraceae bacterium]
MKIVCLCEIAVTPAVMEPMRELEARGAQVVILEDKSIQTPEAFTEAMIKLERQGADAWPADPQFVEEARDADIVVVHVSPVNAAVLRTAGRLKYVAVLRSGVENVRQDLCAQMGIEIINAPGRSALAVADCTVALMLAEMKNIARGHRALMDGRWVKLFANSEYIHDLCNCTVGIVGAGQIGRKVIDRLRGFECGILVHDPFLPDGEIARLGCTPAPLEDLLRRSDIVSLHLRLSEQTRRFISKRELGLMKPTAMLVNTSRGGLVDEGALAEALRDRTIGGAALDVFTEEPLGAGSPLLRLDNVTLTPHIAGTSADTCPNSVKIIKGELMKLL